MDGAYANMREKAKDAAYFDKELTPADVASLRQSNVGPEPFREGNRDQFDPIRMEWITLAEMQRRTMERQHQAAMEAANLRATQAEASANRKPTMLNPDNPEAYSEPREPLVEPPSGLHLSHCTCSLCERPTHPVETCPCWVCQCRRVGMYGSRAMMTQEEAKAALDRLAPFKVEPEPHDGNVAGPFRTPRKFGWRRR
jgi:hypothetical protein